MRQKSLKIQERHTHKEIQRYDKIPECKKSRPENFTQNKGFTLIELILVITLMALLGVAALTTYFSTTKTFQLLADQKQISSTFRMARSNAIYKTTAVNNGVTYQPERFGIKIDKSGNDFTFTLFADTGKTPLNFDMGFALPEENDIPYNEKTFTLKGSDYSIQFVGSQTGITFVSFPLYLFYERGTGEMTMYQYSSILGKPELVPKTDMKYRYLGIILTQNKADPISKNIIINQISGLPEELDKLPN